jgi:phosphatidylglycerophosphatase A
MRTTGSSLRHDPVSMADARRAFAAHPVAALLATGLGSGLSPVAPGTAGSLVGIALAVLLSRALSAAHVSSFAAAAGLLMSGLAVAALGVAVSGPVCRTLGRKDPGCIVIDEIAGQLFAAAAIPLLPAAGTLRETGSWVFAFLLFRFFDVAKPGPIRRTQRLAGGWGVVADDLAAGAAAAASLLVLGRLGAWIGWI